MREEKVTLNKLKETIVKLLDEREFLLSQVEISEKAVMFWEEQMEVLFKKIDENNGANWHPDFNEKNEEYRKQIKCLMKRGELEISTVESLEAKCDELHQTITDFLEEYGNRPEVKKITKARLKDRI
tara:strand:+ start:177 stop:557 length:381 start_codon:yes stop_codon:yes gene_type:complete